MYPEQISFDQYNTAIQSSPMVFAYQAPPPPPVVQQSMVVYPPMNVPQPPPQPINVNVPVSVVSQVQDKLSNSVSDLDSMLTALDRHNMLRKSSDDSVRYVQAYPHPVYSPGIYPQYPPTPQPQYIHVPMSAPSLRDGATLPTVTPYLAKPEVVYPPPAVKPVVNQAPEISKQESAGLVKQPTIKETKAPAKVIETHLSTTASTKLPSASVQQLEDQNAIAHENVEAPKAIVSAEEEEPQEEEDPSGSTERNDQWEDETVDEEGDSDTRVNEGDESEESGAGSQTQSLDQNPDVPNITISSTSHQGGKEPPEKAQIEEGATENAALPLKSIILSSDSKL